MNFYESKFPELDWELINLKLYYYKSKIEVDSLIQLGLKYPSYISDQIVFEMIDFIIEKGTPKEQFLRARNWNNANIKKFSELIYFKYQNQLNNKLMNSYYDK